MRVCYTCIAIYSDQSIMKALRAAYRHVSDAPKLLNRPVAISTLHVRDCALICENSKISCGGNNDIKIHFLNSSLLYTQWDSR